MKKKVPIQKWMMFVDQKIVNFMKKVQKRLSNQNLKKKIACGAVIQALLMVLRGLRGERRSAGFARLAPQKNILLYGLVGSFDWGDTLRRTVGVQQVSASNKYKLLKLFYHINVNSK